MVRLPPMLMALPLLLAGCNEPSQKAPAPAFDDSKLPEVAETIALKLSPAAQQQVAAYNAMALRLYAEAAKREGNVFLSPASIGAALGMAQAGAGPGSAGEFAALLGNSGGAAASAAQGELLKGTSFEARGRVLKVRSSLWLDQSTNLRPGFAETIKRDWNAAIEQADFQGDTQGARDAINQVAARDTYGRIPALLGEDDLGADTRLVLLNTVYFRAPWSSPFEPEATHPAPFHRPDGSDTQVQMMAQTKYSNYLETPTFQAIKLGYDRGETEMAVFLPKSRNGLTAFEKSLGSQSLSDWLGKLDGAADIEVDLKLPKFKIADRLDLAPILQALGLKTAFEPFKADFTAMADAAPGRPLYLSKVIHQTELDVDERGTVAVAATSLEYAAAAAEMEPPKKFIADHPFLFVIRDRRSGLILFIGRFTGGTA